jgi:hypothetical protein
MLATSFGCHKRLPLLERPPRRVVRIIMKCNTENRDAESAAGVTARREGYLTPTHSRI